MLPGAEQQQRTGCWLQGWFIPHALEFVGDHGDVDMQEVGMQGKEERLGAMKGGVVYISGFLFVVKWGVLPLSVA